MLSIRPTTCTECTDVFSLIEKIECSLAKLGSALYGNIVFMLNVPIKAEIFIDLLNYKRILEYKQINPDYCGDYTIDNISSRINILIYKT